MKKNFFSQNELLELEALEVRGGSSVELVVQEECINSITGCARGTAQIRCVNSAANCACSNPGTHPCTIVQNCK